MCLPVPKPVPTGAILPWIPSFIKISFAFVNITQLFERDLLWLATLRIISSLNMRAAEGVTWHFWISLLFASSWSGSVILKKHGSTITFTPPPRVAVGLADCSLYFVDCKGTGWSNYLTSGCLFPLADISFRCSMLILCKTRAFWS